jgi:hypothetical protein
MTNAPEIICRLDDTAAALSLSLSYCKHILVDSRAKSFSRKAFLLYLSWSLEGSLLSDYVPIGYG